MEWLNYHHLLYFWLVVREGGVTRAAARLRLSPPTVSGQVRALEVSLGERLFEKRGRQLVPTEMGRIVYRYADEIFSLGRELVDTVSGRPTGRPARFVVGVVDAVPKTVARMLLEPAWSIPEPLRFECSEGDLERLLAELSRYALDVVISDAPVQPGSNVRAYSHLLGETRISFFARGDLARRYRRGFPKSIDGAPVLLPAPSTALRRTLDVWFEERGLRPRVVGTFEDTGLLEAFGAQAHGIFAAPAVLERELGRAFRVERLGDADGVRERYYAITIERRIVHPAVAAISEAARGELFAESSRKPKRRGVPHRAPA